MHEEQDTCRICSAPAEPDQPLFYPCKCSGTIRYIHQDCLTTWLAHSKKKTCDVCKHPYQFTKVYSSDMPTRLPVILLMRRFAQQVVLAVLFGLRAIMVSFIWLAFLPWATIWTWRLYFTMGDSTAWWISGLPRPPSDEGSTPFASLLFSSSNDSASTSSSGNNTRPISFLSHPLIRSVSADIVSGQIIASLIVLAFVAIFLLREWISQNARPGVFDEGEAPVEAEEPPPPIVAQPPPQGPPQIQPQAEQARRAMPPLRGALALPPVPVRDEPPPPLEPVFKDESQWQRGAVDSSEDEDRNRGATGRKVRRLDDAPAGLPPRQGKGKRVADTDTLKTDQGVSSGVQRRRPSWGEPSATSSNGAASLNLEPEQTQFTFRAPLQPNSITPGSSSHQGGQVPSPSPAWDLYSTYWETVKANGRHEEANLNGSFDALSIPARSLYLNRSSGPGDEANDSVSAGQPRRPPLPSITLPQSPSSGAPSPPSSIERSRRQTPLASPNLATYQPPEEFEAGPSNLNGYFGGATHDDTVNGVPEDVDETLRDDEYGDTNDEEPTAEETMEEMHRIYFRPPSTDGEEEMAEDEDGVVDTPPVHWTDEEWNEEEEEDDEDAAVPFGPAEEDEGDQRGDELPAAEGMQQQPEPAGVEAEAAEMEEAEANAMEDDMDGALEAIGLRGPVYGVLQNAALMIFVLDTAIGIGVWLPYTMGKSLALLFLDPRRFVHLLHSPIRAIRLVTDPVVDSVLFLVARVVLPPLAQMSHLVLNLVARLLAAIIGQGNATKVISLSAAVHNYSMEYASGMWDQAVASLASDSSVPAGPSLLQQLAAEDSAFFRVMEPYFAPIGGAVRVVSQDFQSGWMKMAVGNGTSEKLFAIFLGYAVDGLLLALYLNVLTVGNVKTAGRAVRNAVRQQLLVTKVAAFIVVELVVFPLGCGIMLDLCTVWMFPQGNFRSMTAFLMFAPLTSAFYHWVMGTMFMYQFAVLLAGCRGIMRPGAMWFVKDPQDQNFHPIRDILERSTLVQVRKLLLSAMMYGLVVACGVATISGILRLFGQIIMPFNWRTRAPLSVVPIDLLFLHLVLPYTLHYFRPKKILRMFGMQLWKYLAAQLRLTSYMFGGRHPQEEYSPKHWSWRQLLLRSGIELDDAEAPHDGSFRRVPNSDHIALVKDKRATAEVDELGVPVNAEEARLMALQNAEAEKSKRNIKEDYTVVYIPPYFRYRVSFFILSLWIIGSVLLAASLAIPIVLGRGFFQIFTTDKVHDGYAFLAGFYLLWGAGLAAYAAERMDKRRQRVGGDEPRAEFPLYLAKRSLLWMAQTAYMMFFLGFVIPTLIALVMELYVILPVRHLVDPEVERRIRIVDMWALGLLYTKIVLRAQRLQPGTRIARGVEQILRTGWTNPDPLRATKEVIAPMVFGLLGMILLPPILTWAVRQLFTLPVDDKFLFIHVYPGIFTIAGCGHGAIALSRIIGSWSQDVRDKEFLVEMRLQNLDPEKDKSKEGDVDPEVKDDWE